MLDKLTAEQEARFPEFVNYGLRIGLRTDRTDRSAAEKAIAAHYVACDLAVPKVKWYNSPYASVWDGVGASVRDGVRASVWDSVRDGVGASVWDTVRDSVWDGVGASVWDSVGASVWDSVWDSVGASVWDTVRASVWDTVGAYYDADYASWILAWDQYGISLPKSALTYMKMTELVWWMYPGKDIVYASEPPISIIRNAAGRLHNETGKSVEFSDGTGFSSWQGVTIPDHWVTDRLTVNPAEILAEANVEKRAAGAACIGWPIMLQALDYSLVDSDPDPLRGELIEISGNKLGLPNPGRFLKAECPRNGIICEGVPPHINTVLEAHAWRVGLTPDEFMYPVVRT